MPYTIVISTSVCTSVPGCTYQIPHLFTGVALISMYTCTHSQLQLLNILQPICRGNYFGENIASLGELWSILPPNVHVMVLTATATHILRLSIIKTLGMVDQFILSQSPHKENIQCTPLGHKLQIH